MWDGPFKIKIKIRVIKTPILGDCYVIANRWQLQAKKIQVSNLEKKEHVVFIDSHPKSTVF